MEAEIRMESTPEIPGTVGAKTLAVTATTRMDQLAVVVERLNKLFPETKITIVAQTGKTDSVNNAIAGVNVVEALPGGMLGYGKIPSVKFGAVRALKADIMVVVYNNPSGAGYRLLELAALAFNGKTTLGVFCDDSEGRDKSVFREITLGGIAAPVLMDIAMIPVALAVKAVVEIAYLVAVAIGRIRGDSSSWDRN
ncbi:MAG: hypothetical protein HZB29_13720 [Nitrospinae bacterium]|nr:hypothetical protein [Nitrospinota bacterium]